MLSINLSLNLVQSTVSTLFKTVTIIRSAGAPLQVVCPSPSESDKQVEKILHRCLLKKQAILSEQGVLCFSYIYIRPTAEEYQYNIPPKESSSSDALRIFSYTVVLSLNASTAISITDLHTCCMSDFRYFHIVACKTV